MPISEIHIAERAVGPGRPCYVIAEAGVNHNGSVDLALSLVEAAAAAGADAVKFQTFSAAGLATAAAPKAACQRQTTDPAESQRDMLASLELARDAHAPIRRRCLDLGVAFLSTPFDAESADFLEDLGVAAFKVPSGELTNLPFLAHVAHKDRPMLISTGMAGLGEVETAVQTVERAGNQRFVLLHCVSEYPAEPSRVNLRAMDTLAQAFGVPVGYSDHTTGITTALAAVARGACVLEKHFTLDRGMTGPDHAASLEPHELAELVREVRSVESSLGDGRKQPTAAEADTAAAVRRSLVAAEAIAAGAVITDAMLTTKRPGTGLHPGLRDQVVGRTARVDIPADCLIGPEMLS